MGEVGYSGVGVNLHLIDWVSVVRPLPSPVHFLFPPQIKWMCRRYRLQDGSSLLVGQPLRLKHHQPKLGAVEEGAQNHQAH